MLHQPSPAGNVVGRARLLGEQQPDVLKLVQRAGGFGGGPPAVPVDVELGIIAECLACAVAEGAAVDEAYGELLIAGVAQMPEDSGTSMLYDRLAERLLEYEALSGAVVRAAERHGIDVPLNRALLALLSAAR